MHVTVTVSGLDIVFLISFWCVFVVQKVLVFGDLSKEEKKQRVVDKIQIDVN